MERFVALFPLVLLGALLFAFVVAGRIVVPAGVSAMAVPVLVLGGVVLAVVVVVRAR